MPNKMNEKIRKAKNKWNRMRRSGRIALLLLVNDAYWISNAELGQWVNQYVGDDWSALSGSLRRRLASYL